MELSTDAADGPAPPHGADPTLRRGGRSAGRSRASCPGSSTSTSARKLSRPGVCATLSDDDQITSTHRGHGHLVAKGGDFNQMMAELMGKSTGYCKGQGGSMHISDLVARHARRQRHRRCRLARSRSVPRSPTSTARTATSRSRSSATAPPTSERSTRRPTWRARCTLPIVFVCENNEYGEFTPRAKTMAITDIVDRAAGYGMPGVIVDGMDVVAVHEAAVEAVARARRGEGPSLIEAKTYRFYNHHGVQNLGLKYRTDDEVAGGRSATPSSRSRTRLIEAGTATRGRVDAVWGSCAPTSRPRSCSPRRARCPSPTSCWSTSTHREPSGGDAA